MKRRVRGTVVRLALLGVVAFVLARQIRIDDQLELVGGEQLTGTVAEGLDGAFTLAPADGSALRVLARTEIASRGASGVPAVSWGVRTLAGRLGGRPLPVVAVLALLAGLLAVTAWRWHVLMRVLDLHLGWWRILRLTWIGAFFNQAVPGATGGDVVKAWYAAIATGRGTRSVIAVFADRVIGLLGLALLAGTVLLAVPSRGAYGPARVVVLGVLAAGTLFALLVAAPGLRSRLGLQRLARRLPFQTLVAEAGAALKLYRHHPWGVALAALISIANHAAAATAVWLLADAMSIRGVGLGACFLLVPVANLLSAVPLVPGGWGIGELAFAWLFGAVGVPATEAVGLSVIYRMGVLLVSLPGGALWIFWKDRPTRESTRRRVEEATQAVERVGALPSEAPPPATSETP